MDHRNRHVPRQAQRQGSQRLEHWFWLRVADCERWLGRRFKECRQCRECDSPVEPLDTVCRHCGASDPAKVAVRPIHLIAGFGIAAVIACLWFAWF
ncbi:MAG: hypothetical protein WD403_16140 [Pirellulales bacterium]